MNIFLLILKLVPTIISLIKMAEEAFPHAGAGLQKAEAVTNAVGQVVAAVPAVAEHALAVKAQLQPHIDALVGVLTSLGVINQAKPAASAPAAAPAPGPSVPPL
jgi:hypothetical protein